MMKSPFAGIVCGLLAGCAQPAIVLQLYDAGAAASPVVEVVEDFAAEGAIEIQRPNTRPATSNEEVTLVHGSDWRTASLAWNLAGRLRDFGATVSLRPTRLQNHVVTRHHIGVFLRQPNSPVAQTEEDRVERISQLFCSTPEGDATILMYGNGTLEVQTYIWDGAAISGADYAGTWRTSGSTITFVAGGKELQYEATGCLPTPDRTTPCQGDLHWLRGGSIPVLEGCDISARNMAIHYDRSSR